LSLHIFPAIFFRFIVHTAFFNVHHITPRR
jgi:hypothetical protein